MSRIEIIHGDITRQKVDAIVNAANKTLLGGGGVDGAIHRAAGPALRDACQVLAGCQTGQAKITRGFRLFAKYVIHTVGPVWNGGEKNECEYLAQCYRHVLSLAVKHSVKTIAFPSISTGAYRFPLEKASKIAISEIKKFIKDNKDIKKVSVVCFDKKTYDVYHEALKAV